MAKLIGLIGSGCGKVGNVVLSKGDDGLTIARAYQPQVKNPRTTAQLLQRAKVNLAGQLSSLVSRDLLAPLGYGSARANRSAFARTLLRSTSSVLDSNEKITATIPLPSIQWGRGSALAHATIAAPTVTANLVRLSANVTAQADELGKIGDRFIALILSDEGNTIFDAVYSTEAVYASTGEQTIDIDIAGEISDGHVVAIYRVPFTIADSAAYAAGLNLYGNTTNALANLSVGYGGQLAWGRSELVAAVPFVPAS